MKSKNSKINKEEESLYNLTINGSLGLLAFGDIGLRAWRKVKQESIKKDTE